MVVLGKSRKWVEQEARDLADKLRPSIARLLTTENILGPQAEASKALRSAQVLFERSGLGLGRGLKAPEVEVPKDPEKRRMLEEQIDKVFENVEKSLQAIEVAIQLRRKQSKVTRTTPFVLAVSLFLLALAGFGWGIVYGSHIALFGSGGAITFAVTVGFVQIHRYNREQIALDTLVSRTRARVATCRSQDLMRVEDCLRHALGLIDDYFAEIRAVASSGGVPPIQ
jgi:hypothetical protein